jgi:RNA methyltransferase, TrmH family
MAGKVQSAVDAALLAEFTPRVIARRFGYDPLASMIESTRNPRVQSLLRSVEERKLFVLEGEKFILDAAAGRFEFEEIFHDDHLKPGRLAVLARHRTTPVSREVLARFCEASSPQHAVGIARRRESSTSEILSASGSAVYLDAVQDPGNLGAVARVVEAVSGAGILASEGCADFFHPRALRGSAGSLLRLKAASSVDFRLAAEEAKTSGREICGTGGRSAEDLFSARFEKPVLWVFGSEGAGLSPAVRRHVERRIAIPLAPPVESLNVAVAAGVILFTVARQGTK